jgi:hypothetical protein
MTWRITLTRILAAVNQYAGEFDAVLRRCLDLLRHQQ